MKLKMMYFCNYYANLAFLNSLKALNGYKEKKIIVTYQKTNKNICISNK